MTAPLKKSNPPRQRSAMEPVTPAPAAALNPGVVENAEPQLVVSLEDWVASGSDLAFRNLLNSLIRLGNLMRGNQERFASYIGVSVPGFQILVALEVAPRSTVGNLAARLEVTSQFVTLESGKLIERGLIEKHPNEQDRRSVMLDLTRAGRSLLAEVTHLRRKANDRMFRSLGADKGAELLAIVTALLVDGHEARHLLEGPNWRELRAPSLQTASNQRRGT
jgi:DNA-binding MarR family transcriptional regulator